ncbi:carboxylesterase/lipase family protein [Corynebacterium aquatimens]|uniref:carboxylesterase/lipase family protein n=1 Tax=Corynebacterium TaxID=1716 RepID=UPI001F471BCB|nr:MULTISPECIES: carboxylesterase/lipase family protein [Corynebacterium]QYH19919.1 carboxylesterase/lipase family protein [Corynebacterium aquatimens]UIZ92913.1 carboxylesterase/lipase family protein [Corynebacterium sp. CNCTC7651]
MDAAKTFDVPTRAGTVRGFLHDRTGVRTWRGVPYGATTAGQHRFRAPRPPVPWSGVRDASRFAKPAMQGSFGWKDSVFGTEDCLTLDIVRPDTEDELPVVVYFHGGTFVTGASNEKVLRGYYLSKATEVVYVSVNFRLGVLGYLDFRSIGADCVANPAMLDQIQALEWVQENIRAFGGDPSRVTIMGESAGGAAVIHLMCAPAARGLFHGAVAQSPPSASVHSKMQAAMWVRELIDGMGMSRLSTLDDLRAADAEDLVRTGQSMLVNGKELVQLNTSFMPTVDEVTLPEHPIDMFESGKQAAVPLIIGTNSEEASFAKAMYQTVKQRQRAARRVLDVYDRENAQVVLDAYDNVGGRADFAELVADAIFWAPSVMLATAHRRVAPTWMYRFEYASETMRRLGLGAMHTSDLGAVFGDPFATKASKIDRFGSLAGFDQVKEVMQYHWGSFFHTGAPGEEWPVYGFRSEDEPGRATFVLDSEPSVVLDPKADQRRAWEAFDMREWGDSRDDIWESMALFFGFDLPEEAE